MAVVVVGGHSRDIGKTSVVAGLIDGLREMRWTAIKITQYGHNVCSANGESCDCATADHAVAISQEVRPSATDSGRYLGAGAARSLWVRTRQGELVSALPRLRREIQASGNTVIESNSILRFLRPDLYLSVLDPSVADFKKSARQYLDRADAVLVPEEFDLASATWKGVGSTLYRGRPILIMRRPNFITVEILDFVRAQLGRVDGCREASTPASARVSA